MSPSKRGSLLARLKENVVESCRSDVLYHCPIEPLQIARVLLAYRRRNVFELDTISAFHKLFEKMHRGFAWCGAIISEVASTDFALSVRAASVECG